MSEVKKADDAQQYCSAADAEAVTDRRSQVIKLWHAVSAVVLVLAVGAGYFYSQERGGGTDPVGNVQSVPGPNQEAQDAAQAHADIRFSIPSIAAYNAVAAATSG
ncbi:MAG: hypothetical protein ABR521_04310 [Gaiellaceae bacterium]